MILDYSDLKNVVPLSIKTIIDQHNERQKKLDAYAITTVEEQLTALLVLNKITLYLALDLLRYLYEHDSAFQLISEQTNSDSKQETNTN